MGLLPEVKRRKLYEKKGFASVFEFGEKLAGLSEKQVRTALNLGDRFTDKPILKSLLESGEVSINKLARIVSMATPENDSELAQIVKILSKSAIETLVRDEKMLGNGGEYGRDFSKQNGLPQPLFNPRSLPGQTKFQLSGEVIEELNRLQEQGQDVNAILLELLKQRNVKIQEKKEEIAEGMIKKAAGETVKMPSRHAPVAVKAILKEEFGTKCSMEGCKNLAEELHHTQIFAISKNNDPRYLAPMCKNHHLLAHAMSVQMMEKRMG